MAKESVKARDRKRRYLAAKYAAKRVALKKQGNYIALDKLPKNASPVRLRNRCNVTGRARGYIRKFGVSRLVFRQWALEGKLPGIRKASW
ncbi:30S ribosomal protein S14 [Cardinium endosymbiont of Oedothorax gibbosus]|uniref:30S ribosomal protein S14 n=1 Tax=Cardinium endosymbiont of Oedothorax gibbosus TaxID=931101 RepID=UPI002024D408|nr:30S ribosomal protein S14 [Cardinium endosymbiont of Oedothorax gibbosus]CAH2559728.1 30S ribosomal protein S14 [Cardinium endosymbiont of Oedothorax gibbosus]